MVEFLDGNVGAVYEAWNGFLSRGGREGLFVYLSDHGDQLGERSLYGKKPFFESSARIPLLFSGSGITAGARIASPVSIMDLGPTLCDIAGAESPPDQDGESLLDSLTEDVPASGSAKPAGRCIISEAMEHGPETPVPGRMLRRGRWKYVTYAGYEQPDLLFDLESDPDELHNLASHCPEVVLALRSPTVLGWNQTRLAADFGTRNAHLRLVRRWIKNADPDQSEKWQPTAEALQPPEPYYSSPNPLPPNPEDLGLLEEYVKEIN